MLRATVPKTAVHENRDLQRVKYEVGSSEHGTMSSPAAHAVTAQENHQGEFRILVAAPANPRHDFGAFRLGENIRHSESFREVIA
jgi:hypothetical protein